MRATVEGLRSIKGLVWIVAVKRPSPIPVTIIMVNSGDVQFPFENMALSMYTGSRCTLVYSAVNGELQELYDRWGGSIWHSQGKVARFVLAADLRTRAARNRLDGTTPVAATVIPSGCTVPRRTPVGTQVAPSGRLHVTGEAAGVTIPYQAAAVKSAGGKAPRKHSKKIFQ